VAAISNAADVGSGRRRRWRAERVSPRQVVLRRIRSLRTSRRRPSAFQHVEPPQDNAFTQRPRGRRRARPRRGGAWPFGTIAPASSWCARLAPTPSISASAALGYAGLKPSPDAPRTAELAQRPRTRRRGCRAGQAASVRNVFEVATARSQEPKSTSLSACRASRRHIRSARRSATRSAVATEAVAGEPPGAQWQRQRDLRFLVDADAEFERAAPMSSTSRRPADQPYHGGPRERSSAPRPHRTAPGVRRRSPRARAPARSRSFRVPDGRRREREKIFGAELLRRRAGNGTASTSASAPASESRPSGPICSASRSTAFTECAGTDARPDARRPRADVRCWIRRRGLPVA